MRSSRAPYLHDAVGWLWLTAWSAAVPFVIGAALLGLLFAIGNAGPFGIGAVGALLLMALALVQLVALAVAALLDRLLSDAPHPPAERWLIAAGALALVGGVVLLAIVAANLAGVPLAVDVL